MILTVRGVEGYVHVIHISTKLLYIGLAFHNAIIAYIVIATIMADTVHMEFIPNYREIPAETHSR